MAYSMKRNNDGTYSMPSSAEQKQQREDGTYAANAAKNAANNSSSSSESKFRGKKPPPPSDIKQMPSPAAPRIPDKSVHASWSYEKLCYR